jgi:hypothetical protein
MAYTFNGTNQYLTAPLSFPGYPLTFSVCASFSSLSTNPFVISFDTPVSGIYRIVSLSVTSAGVARAIVFNDNASGSAFAASPSGAVAINTPYVLTTVFTSSSSRSIFVNANKYSNTDSLTISSPTRFAIGCSWDSASNSFFNSGSIAEAAVWNAALTDAEVASLAAGFTPDQIRPQSLQFYAPLIRDLADLRLGRTITNVNSATVSTHPRIIQ